MDSFEQIEMNRAIGVSDLNSIKEVRRLIKKYNPDIVYAHSSKAGAIARVADIGLKNHCVCSTYGEYCLNNVLGGYSNLFTKIELLLR